MELRLLEFPASCRAKLPVMVDVTVRIGDNSCSQNQDCIIFDIFFILLLVFLGLCIGKNYIMGIFDILIWKLKLQLNANLFSNHQIDACNPKMVNI
jgi:hypothetical protein